MNWNFQIFYQIPNEKNMKVWTKLNNFIRNEIFIRICHFLYHSLDNNSLKGATFPNYVDNQGGSKILKILSPQFVNGPNHFLAWPIGHFHSQVGRLNLQLWPLLHRMFLHLCQGLQTRWIFQIGCGILQLNFSLQGHLCYYILI